MRILLSFILSVLSVVSFGQNPFVSKYITTTPLPRPNIPPVANAGIDQTIQLPLSQVTIDGSLSSDVGGGITGYAWLKLSGSGTITSPSSVTSTVTGLTAGTTVIELTVTDNSGDTDTDTVSIYTNAALNIPPVANAGANQVITLPTNFITLNGVATDADGTIVSTVWVMKSVVPLSGTITDPNSDTTTVTNLEAGRYLFQFTVTDNNGAVGIDTVEVLVNPTATPFDGKITFTLASQSHVSLGIYGYSDSVLQATLFSDSIMAAGTHTVYWNGTNDTGAVIAFPASKYMVKILTNNVAYTWIGTLGNTSDSMTGIYKHRGYYYCMRGLAFSGLYGYYCTGYPEGSPSMYKFLKTAPNVKLNLAATGVNVTTADINYVAADANTVYWLGFDPYATNNSFVFATNTSNDLYKTFSSGQSYQLIRGDRINVISYVNVANARGSGLAVQQSGNYLFVARSNLNQLQVLNKTTGALVQTLTYTNPTSLSIDASDNLWMTTDSLNVRRYVVNVDGTLSAPNLSISGLSKPLAIAVSFDGANVTVADGATDQRVKFYSTTTGASIATLGTTGGYISDATVNNNKFMFSDSGNVAFADPKQLLPFIAYQSDGSFWVGDAGNSRVQHYDASRSFINRIMSLGATYYVFVDNNNRRRVFANYLEFDIDYSQPLATGWTLVKNWGANVTSRYDKSGLAYINTLSNGKTYGFIRNGANWEVVEFVSGTGNLRRTGVLRTGLNSVLTSDGSIQKYTRGVVGGVSVMQRYALTGFDGSNNPTWSLTPTILFTTPTLTAKDPNEIPRYPALTSSGKVINFGYGAAITQVNNRITVAKDGYHLWAFQSGTSIPLFKTELGTHINYMGAFPKAGRFDVGNLVNDFAGGSAAIIGRNIITSYHGEFWKNSQTNKYNHYLDNGLAVGQFGITRPTSGTRSAAEMAGNVLNWGAIASVTGDTIFVYHGDESDHSGIHQWVITGMNTIAQQNIVLDYPTSPTTPALNYTQLLTGLPFDRTLTTGTASWNRLPIIDTVISQYADHWTVNTSVLTYNKLWPPDIYIKFASPTVKTNTVWRGLGSNNVTTKWSITGNVDFGTQLNGQGNNRYIDVLDNTNKIICRLSDSLLNNKVRGNATVIANYAAGLNAFSMGVNAGTVSFTYNGVTQTTAIFDGTADWHRPTTLRLSFVARVAPNYGVRIGLSELRLYLDAP